MALLNDQMAIPPYAFGRSANQSNVMLFVMLQQADDGVFSYRFAICAKQSSQR